MDTFHSKINLPPGIRANLAAGEQILFAERGLYLVPQAVKWFLLAFSILFDALITANMAHILPHFDLEVIPGVVLLLVFPVMYLILWKTLFVPSVGQLVVTNQRVFEWTQSNRSLCSIHVKHLKAICVRDQKILPDGTVTGTLDLFAEQLGEWRRYKLSLPNVENLPPKLRVLESIAWHFGRNSVEGNGGNEMVTIPLDPAYAKKIARNATIRVILLIVGGAMGIIGGSMFPFFLNAQTAPGIPVSPALAVSILLFAFGFTIFIMAPILLDGGLRKVIGSPHVTGLRVEQEQLVFSGSNPPACISIRDLDHMDVIQSRTIYTGAVRFFTPAGPDPVVVFGPIANYCETLGHIYSAILAWKASHGQLLPPEQLPQRYVATENEPEVNLKVEVPRNYPAEVKATPPPPHLARNSSLSEVPIDDAPLVSKYLDPTDHVLFRHTPVVTTRAIRLATLISIVGSVWLPLSFVILNNPTFLNVPEPLYTGIMIGCIPLGIVTCLGWCWLASLLAEKKMTYFFTTQKMIFHTPNRVVSVGYDNMILLQQRAYWIEVTLVNPIEKHSAKFSYLDRTMYIFGVPKTSDLFSRVKTLKDAFAAKKN